MTTELPGDAIEWDVGLSFLSADLRLAEQIADAVAPLRCFVFNREQRRLAGGNAIEEFAHVFRRQVRLGVILWREGYGATQITGVEQAAIRDRAAQTQFRSMLLVNLDGSQPPAWMSRHEIWLDFKLYGLSEAVGAIKFRAQEQGAALVPESPFDLAVRSARESQDAVRRQQLAVSEEGIAELPTQMKLLIEETQRLAARANDEIESLSVVCKTLSGSPPGIMVESGPVRTWVQYRQRAINSLRGSDLRVERSAEWDPPTQSTLKYTLALAAGDVWVWRSERGSEHSSSELANVIVAAHVREAQRRPTHGRQGWQPILW
jgi:hypothetical protein